MARVIGWKHSVVGDGGVLLLTGVRIPYYQIPNIDIERRGVSQRHPSQALGAVGHVFNVFAIESLVDEMAVAANMDPIQFRIEKNGGDSEAPPLPRRGFAKMCDWNAPRPEGRALGVR